MNPLVDIRSPGAHSSDSEHHVVVLKPNGNDVLSEFSSIASLVASRQNDLDLRPSVVRVSAEISPSLLDPFSDSDSLESVVALLILGFPDVEFEFCNVHWGNMAATDADTSLAKSTFQSLRLQTEHPESFFPLFDPFGLRAWILWRLGRVELYDEADGHDNRLFLINRGQDRCRRSPDSSSLADNPNPALAVVLEDESPYSLFAGYICYRFGYLTQTIRSRDAALLWLGPSSAKAFSLAIQDIWLNFTAENNVRLELRSDRYRVLPRLANAERVATISTDTWPDDPDCTDRRDVLVRKPFPGMFAFWNDVWQGTEKSRTTVDARFSDSYCLLPVGVSDPSDTPKLGHAVPARVIALAEFLTQRAYVSMNGSRSIRDAVISAVLASDALDLIAGRAVTTALEALSMKHQCEVLCECRFMGVRMEIDIRDRFAELEIAASRLLFHVTQEDRASTQNSALMEIATRVARIFRDHGRFQEEQDALAYHRKYFLKFLWSQRNPVSRMKACFLLYPHWLLQSMGSFVLILVILIAAFTFIHISMTDPKELAAHCMGSALTACYSAFLANTSASFLNIQLWADDHAIWRVATVVVGIFHLSILFTYVYTALSRK